MHSNTPLSQCTVDDVLTEVTPFFDWSLHQMVDSAYSGEVEASQEHTLTSLVDWLEIWGIGQPQLW